jgi:glycosyltransferase involved in cell wall biosynthesis
MALIGSVRTTYTAKQLHYERWSYRTCAVIVCNSPHLQAQLVEQARIPANRVCYIPNGVDTERFARNPDPTESARLRGNARHVLIMFGRITEQKSPHLLAQAVGLLKEQRGLPDNLRVVIVGERENQTYQQKLDEDVIRYALQDVIRQYPQTAQPEVFYHTGDVTVLATLWEGLPNVALESLAAGRPVIISEAANAAGVIEHGVNGWIVRTGDVAHLAETLAMVLALPPETIQTIRAACVRRASDFSIERMVQRYDQLYARLWAMPNPYTCPR